MRDGATNGTLIGTFTVSSTGGATTFSTQEIAVSSISGLHTLYFLSRNDNVANIDYVQFDLGSPQVDNAGGASGIMTNSAVLNGTLASVGSAPAAVWVFWGTSDGITNKGNWAHADSFGVNVGTPPVAYATNVTGLSPGTTYYYRYYASNAVGEAWADSSASFNNAVLAVPGCRLWLEANAGVTADGSGNISAWTDQSGNGNNLGVSGTAPTLAANVLNGGPVVRFATNGYFTASKVLSTDSNASMFMVCRGLKGVSQKIFDGNSTGTAPPGTIPQRRIVTCETAGNGSVQMMGLYSANYATNQYLCVSATFDSASGVAKLYLNGASAAVSNNFYLLPSASPFTVGARFSGSDKYGGDIAEVVLYNGALSDANRQVVEGYLINKWLASPPVLTQDPVSSVIPCGANATFAVTAGGAQPLAYQWYFNSNSIPWGTNAILTLTNASAANNGFYFAAATNIYGGITSAAATLTVTSSPPLITFDPQSTTAPCGGSATFTVAASSCAPITGYQWFLGANPVPGSNAATLTVGAMDNSKLGAYYAVVSNAAGSAISAAAYLTLGFTENFDDAATVAADGWQGYNTNANGNNFGFRTSNVSGGANGAGEAGGTFARRNAIVYYGDTTLGGTLTLANALHADGELGTANYASFNGDLLIGFFNTNSANQTTFANFLGFRFVDPGNGTVGNRIAAIIYPASGVNTSSAPLDSGTTAAATYRFRMDYDPVGGVNTQGRLALKFFNSSGNSIGVTNCDLTAAQRAVGANFNAFGFVNGQNADDSTRKFDLYIDAVTYTVASICAVVVGTPMSCALSNGQPVLVTTGLTNYSYTLQRSATLSPPAWSNIATVVPDSQGHVQYVDTNAPSTNAFYRTRYP